MNILEFAINMELEGEKYYIEQAEINKENSLETVFLLLAKDESRHAKVLQKKADGLSYDLGQDEMHTKAASIFHELGAINIETKQTPDQLDAYRLALKNEKESIILYQKFLSEATNDESKKLFAYLIEQEENHYAIINQLILLISRSQEWVEAAEFGLREDY